LCLLKTVFAIGLIGLASIDVSFWAFRPDVKPVDMLDPGVRILTFGSILALIYAERRAGQRISAIQFLFFSVYLTAQLVDLYGFVHILMNGKLLHPLPFVTFVLSMIFVICSLACHFFAEPRSQYSSPSETSFTGVSKHSDDKDCPELDASFPSHLTFSWFTGFAWTGFKRSLTPDDLWDLAPSITSAKVVPKFLKNWQEILRSAIQFNTQHCLLDMKDTKVASNGDTAAFNHLDDSVNVKTKPEPKKLQPKVAHVFPALARTFGFRFFVTSIQKLVHDSLIFVAPLLLKLLIRFADSKDFIWQGVIYAFLLFLASVLQTIFLSRYFYDMYLIGIWIKTSLISAIYRKSLNVSSAGKKESTTGEVVNLMSVDTQRVVDMMPYVNMIWSAPFQIGVALFLLWQTLGPSVLAGFFVMILLIPLNGMIASKSRMLQQKQMKEKDQRVKMMNEILQGMRS